MSIYFWRSFAGSSASFLSNFEVRWTLPGEMESKKKVIHCHLHPPKRYIYIYEFFFCATKGQARKSEVLLFFFKHYEVAFLLTSEWWGIWPGKVEPSWHWNSHRPCKSLSGPCILARRRGSRGPGRVKCVSGGRWLDVIAFARFVMLDRCDTCTSLGSFPCLVHWYRQVIAGAHSAVPLGISFCDGGFACFCQLP